ncbi:DUF2799 domain-containing protein [Dickeya lacustris]|uniref:DUF2799 domain-containing protein n=1 Tax=Dickeya lacustris TaxID=2259638 RepID=A0ABY8GAI8_9GAMM|nr:DUF2799 domain-containing protein [Dickeya lacustris]WFN56990.1 DUF2799 domain-containing protein [Dickeya lacustris]
MTKTMVLTTCLLLTGCHSLPVPPVDKNSHHFWYDIGYKDATSGGVVKDNEMLSEWSDNTDIDRPAYLAGYGAGQTELCRPATLVKWGQTGKTFPSSCDSVQGAEKLRQIWQSAIDQTHISTNAG